MEKKQFIAGRLLDGGGGSVQRNVLMEVEDERIVSISAAEAATRKEDAEVVDLSHCTLLPPLVDCFVQLTHSSATDIRTRQTRLTMTESEADLLISRNLHYNHSHGVLALANYDDESGHVARFLTREKGSATLISNSVNSFSSQPDKNRPILKSACSFLPLWGIERFSPEVGALVQGEQVMKMVEDAELRITSTGSESPSFVIGLANGKEAIVEALKKGCRAILQGNGMSESCLQRMAEEKVVWIPNLLSLKTLAEQESGKYTGEAMGLLKKQHAALVIAREKGVAIAMGTGAGSSSIIHGESAVEEMKLLKGAGLSLAEVLRCSGFVGADLLGCGNMGLLRKGYDATFLVSRGTAAQLPRKLSYLENIYIKGRPSIAYRKNPVKTFYKR